MMYDNSMTRFMDEAAIARAMQEYMTKVYMWMVGGLVATALTALYVYSNDWDIAIAGSSLFYVLIFGQLGLVIALSGWIGKMSTGIAGLAFIAYSVLTGITFSVLLRAFTEESIYTTFFVTAGMFGALSLYGYITKRNLSGLGSFMFMGLVGLIIASLVNLFLASSMLHFVITVIGVIVFSGLTAYDTQRIKEMYILQQQGDEMAAKGAILGALMLYLDFINLFLFLLRIFGNRN